ncbi:MAG: hypothetical protein Q9213_002961 [Squamulea squamosa]
MQQLNAARGRLRTVMHRNLYEPNAILLNAKCSCRKATLYDYEKTLTDIEVWPLEKVAQTTSMTLIIQKLAKFSFEPEPGTCSTCKKDYKTLVERAREITKDYFDGLCLDCLDISNPKTGSSDADYWNHTDLDEDAVYRNCRVVHGQPTWYYSFMGRRDVRDEFMTKRRKRRYEGDSE